LAKTVKKRAGSPDNLEPARPGTLPCVCAQVPALDEADFKSVQPNRVFLALQGWFHRVCRDGPRGMP